MGDCQLGESTGTKPDHHSILCGMENYSQYWWCASELDKFQVVLSTRKKNEHTFSAKKSSNLHDIDHCDVWHFRYMKVLHKYRD